MVCPSGFWKHWASVCMDEARCCPEVEAPVYSEETDLSSLWTWPGIVLKPTPCKSQIQLIQSCDANWPFRNPHVIKRQHEEITGATMAGMLWITRCAASRALVPPWVGLECWGTLSSDSQGSSGLQSSGSVGAWAPFLLYISFPPTGFL